VSVAEEAYVAVFFIYICLANLAHAAMQGPAPGSLLLFAGTL
jgi:hypothetical protein